MLVPHDFLPLFRFAHVTHSIGRHLPNISMKKMNQDEMTVGTDRHRLADWTLGYSRRAGPFETRCLGDLALGTFRAPALCGLTLVVLIFIHPSIYSFNRSFIPDSRVCPGDSALPE